MRLLFIFIAIAASIASQCSALGTQLHHARRATKPIAPRLEHSPMPDPDDLYRRRGYGIGGSAFGLGPGGTAMAGACADLRFGVPRSCGHGYGIYGNGLGYGFGF